MSKNGSRARPRLLQQMQTVIVNAQGEEKPYLEQYFDSELPGYARAFIYELAEDVPDPAELQEEGEPQYKTYTVVQLAGTLLFLRGVVH